MKAYKNREWISASKDKFAIIHSHECLTAWLVLLSYLQEVGMQQHYPPP